MRVCHVNILTGESNIVRYEYPANTEINKAVNESNAGSIS